MIYKKNMKLVVFMEKEKLTWDDNPYSYICRCDVLHIYIANSIIYAYVAIINYN